MFLGENRQLTNQTSNVLYICIQQLFCGVIVYFDRNIFFSVFLDFVFSVEKP